MKVMLHDTMAGPLWLSAAGNASEFYRCVLPARCTGGDSHTTIMASIDGGAVEALPLGRHFEATPDAEATNLRLSAAREVAIYNLGSVTFFRCDALALGNLARLIDGINDAGGVAWADLDDDWLHFPHAEHVDRHYRIFTEYDKPRGTPAELQELERQTWERTCSDMQQVLAAARGVVVSTETLAAVARPFNGNTHVVENAVDPTDADLTPDRLDGDAAKLRLGFSGFWSHYDDLLFAWPALRAAASRRRNTHLAFIGCHPAMGASGGLTPGWKYCEGVRYSFFGVGTDPRIYAGVLRHFDVMVRPLQPTLANRARAGSAWMEAALCEVATVVTDLEPYACVEDGVTGLKAPPDDAEAFAKAVGRLVDDDALRHRIAANARNDVLANHTVTVRASAWRELVASATGQPVPVVDDAEIAADATRVRQKQLAARYGRPELWQTPLDELAEWAYQGAAWKAPSLRHLLERNAFRESRRAWWDEGGERSTATAGVAAAG